MHNNRVKYRTRRKSLGCEMKVKVKVVANTKEKEVDQIQVLIYFILQIKF